tara:strand:+ start:1475 stop:1720 length:246 start_codon:yes stop_codon:yes gene_type:complete
MKTSTKNKKMLAYAKSLGFTGRVSETGECLVSAEEGDGAADYYGEFRGGYPYVNEKLEAKAKKLGGFWEWENPGVIVFYAD